jgi:hypothetical protein
MGLVGLAGMSDPGGLRERASMLSAFARVGSRAGDERLRRNTDQNGERSHRPSRRHGTAHTARHDQSVLTAAWTCKSGLSWAASVDGLSAGAPFAVPHSFKRPVQQIAEAGDERVSGISNCCLAYSKYCNEFPPARPQLIEDAPASHRCYPF